MHKRFAFITAFIYLAIPLFLHAGAFLQKKGETFLSFQFYKYKTAQFFNMDRQKQPSNNLFDKNEWNLYVEHGITEKDTLAAKAMYARIFESVNPNSEGFEDFELSWRHLLCKKGQKIFSFQFLTVIPSGGSFQPSLHYDRFAFEPMLLASKSFERPKKHYGFLDAGLSYRFYAGFPSDQIRGFMSVGYDIFTFFQLIGSTFLEYGVFNGHPINNINNILFNADYRLLKMDLTGRLKLYDKFSLVFGYYKHVWGQNVGTGGGVHAGIWADF